MNADNDSFIPALGGVLFAIKGSEFDITKALPIEGLDNDRIDLSASGGHGLFHVHENAELSLSPFILTNGAANTNGGIILNESAL